MAVLGVVILGLVIFPVALFLGRSAKVWCPERRQDAKLAVGGFGALCFGLGLAVVISPPHAALWQAVIVPPVIAALGGEIALSLIAMNLLLLDRVTGRTEMTLRTMFGSGGENIQRRIPFYSLRTPLYALRRNRGDETAAE